MQNPLKILALLFIALLLPSCERAAFDEEDLLYELGIMGRWEISSRTINGITDLTINCCEFLVLDGDSTSTDLAGQWFYDDGDTLINQGTFVVDTLEGDIQFYSQNSTFSRNYVVVSYDVIYLEHYVGSTYFEEIWRRR